MSLGLEPLALMGLSAVLAMLVSARAPRIATKALAAAGLLAAIVLAVAQTAPDSGSSLLAGDALARLGIGLSALCGLAALALLRPQETPPEAPALVVLATLGAAIVSGASHAASLFLGLELVTLALVALSVGPRSPTALEAGYKLLLLSGIGTAMLLMGLALGYAATGSLDLAAWSAPEPALGLGLALLIAGLAFKFALAPFHMWAPDLFTGAPAAAALVAGAISKIAVTVALIRLAAAVPPGTLLPTALAALGTLSAVFGSLLALRQPSLPRMLGYSSIAHSGYVALILASGAEAAGQAALIYIAAYAAGLTAALAVAAAHPPQADLRGLAWSQPVAAGALTLGLLSLAGLPVSLGFWAKFQLFSTLLDAGAWLLVAPALAAAALGLWFYGSFVLTLFKTAETAPPGRPSLPERATMLAAAALILALGAWPAPLAWIAMP